MFYLIVIALLFLSGSIAHTYKKNILDVTAVNAAGLLMVMYVLAFFKGLKLTCVVAAAAVLFVVVKAFLASGRGGSFGKEIRLIGKELLDPMLILFVLCVSGVGFATSAHVFTWWDDINYWSSDARQLFFINGFPGKYGNVSPEFGDYPPVTSLAKWLFLQISPGEYKESLQFLGYFALNGVFLLPLLSKIEECIDGLKVHKAYKAVLHVLGFVAVMFLPGVFNGIIYYGTPADITMAIVYGALLLAVFDRSPHGKTFYYVRIGLFSAVLLLAKSIGFEWGIFAFAFYLLVAEREKEIILSAIGAGSALGSWLMFCFVNRRVAKLTGAGIRMATSGNYTAPDNTMVKMRYFFEGFWFWPMHADRNLSLDISTGAAVILIFVGIFLMYYKNILGKTETKRIALFTLITGLLAYGIVFLAHISIFQTEDQYLDAYAMAISIARYCAPFALGTAYLLIGILFGRLKAKSGKQALTACLVCLALIFATADYSGMRKYLFNYRDAVNEDKAYVDDMVGDEGRALVETVNRREYYGKRILVFRDGHSYYWVHNAYISKAASPVALVYDEFMVEEDTQETLKQKIKESHASYIYVEDSEGVSRELFSELLPGEDFSPGKVYSTDGIVY